jgi:sec-independent protein translocase protein TatA
MLPFGFGTTELLIILALALIVFGPKRLPDVGRTLGRATRDFKNSVGEIDEIKQSFKVDLDEPSTRKDKSASASAEKKRDTASRA